MKKRIAVVAIAALMAGSLTNVGAVSAAEPTEITFWHYMSEDKEGKFVNEAIEEFNNSQDEVHVTAQYLPREELMKQYTIGVVSGELPDCGMVDNPDHASYASMGVFEDITDLYNSWDEADFMEGSINSCYYDDKLYGLPWGNNCLGLFYNKSMLEEAGVEVPTTWSELEAACEKLTTDTCKGLAISAIGNEEGTFQYMPWLLSAGGSVDNLTSDESKESMTYLKDFGWNDLVYSMTFNTKDTMRPMTSAIYTYMNQYGTKWNSIMAYGVLLILPCCIIFLTMQKHIVEGMTSGSVKG